MKTKGMSSLNEDDVRRIAKDEMSNVLDEFYGTLADRLLRKFKSLPQATDTDPPATNGATARATARDAAIDDQSTELRRICNEHDNLEEIVK